MSKIKDLFNHMFRAIDEFKMMDSPHQEIMAFATGLRDGSEDLEPMVYSVDAGLQGFYKQGFKHGKERIDANGFKIQ